jgi:tetratricopeptide (TPR) repeat protein
MRQIPRRFGSYLAALVLAVAFFPPAFAGQQNSLAKADELFAAEKWEEAAQAYEAVVKTEPANGRAWFRLGTARQKLRRLNEAIAAFERAEQIHFAPATSRFNIAACLALLNEKEKAIESLSKSADAGFPNFKALESDEDFASLRDDPRFAKITEQVRRAALPCEYDPVYQQFDFWVGDWDVLTPGGAKAGTNSIQKVAGGCALLENWSSIYGGGGKSLNFYEPSKHKWVQMWADSSGEIIPTEGEYKDGAMHLEGELIEQSGKKSLYRGTWTPLPDGRVHQFLEQSLDGGKTWNTWFDGFYSRRKSTGG